MMENINTTKQSAGGAFEISPRVFAKNILGFQNELKDNFESPVTDFLGIIIGEAIILGISDIHIEPQEKNAKIRARLDGILQDILEIPLKNYESVLSRIKLISGIKLNITNHPQDGRFTALLEGKPIEIRTSTLPAEYGESTVLRVLNPKSLITLKDLGLREDVLKTLEKELKKPNGMIIVTGPTGSGKTTTLYAFLKETQKPEVKIITIEDPIEYHLPGISQTQTNAAAGYDFASGLKSILRQDPDVILIGEIRDLETVEIAIQASLTGHMVFSTLHTNDAAGTIARLASLGAKAANIASALNMIVAQRLVRKICRFCSKPDIISPENLKKIKKELEDLPKSVKLPKITETTKIQRGHGCEKCNNTGYLGRLGIFEIFLVDDEMEKFILTNPSIAALRKELSRRNMISMKQDGFIKILEGITTIEEVERVSGE
ncbi:MAG: GspE/PulE family protein [Candidatus Parcubacteria bacterium]|nr:GspE/PulE family protein [Candidatus Parcubacteria bacterium]